jgi:hypothetical protein
MTTALQCINSQKPYTLVGFEPGSSVLWADVYDHLFIGQLFENCLTCAKFWATFSTVKVMQKIGWVTIWPISLQTHPVTLTQDEKLCVFT